LSIFNLVDIFELYLLLINPLNEDKFVGVTTGDNKILSFSALKSFRVFGIGVILTLEWFTDNPDWFIIFFLLALWFLVYNNDYKIGNLSDFIFCSISVFKYVLLSILFYKFWIIF